MTPEEPSHPQRNTRQPADTLARVLTIVIGTDEDALPGGEMRWRLVAQTDDEDVATGVMELLIRRCFSEPPSLA